MRSSRHWKPDPRRGRLRSAQPGAGMTAYVHGEIEVTDAAAYEGYRLQVPAMIAAYGGRYLVRGRPPSWKATSRPGARSSWNSPTWTAFSPSTTAPNTRRSRICARGSASATWWRLKACEAGGAPPACLPPRVCGHSHIPQHRHPRVSVPRIHTRCRVGRAAAAERRRRLGRSEAFSLVHESHERVVGRHWRYGPSKKVRRVSSRRAMDKISCGRPVLCSPFGTSRSFSRVHGPLGRSLPRAGRAVAHPGARG